MRNIGRVKKLLQNYKMMLKCFVVKMSSKANMTVKNHAI